MFDHYMTDEQRVRQTEDTLLWQFADAGGDVDVPGYNTVPDFASAEWAQIEQEEQDQAEDYSNDIAEKFLDENPEIELEDAVYLEYWHRVTFEDVISDEDSPAQESAGLRAVYARNAETIAEPVLRRLASDEHPGVRKALAEGEVSLPGDVLEALAHDDDEMVRETATKRRQRS